MIRPAIILSPEEIAVLGRWIASDATGAGRLAAGCPASARRSRNCAGVSCGRSPNTFSKFQPAGRLSGSSLSLSGWSPGRLGVLSSAMRAAEKAPSVGLFREDIGDADYLLAFVTPPAAEQATQKPLPREVVFVIDNSGSMDGTSIEQAKASLLYAIGRLQPNDRFNIIRFEDTMDVLFPVSLPADAAHVRKAASFGRGAVLLQEEGAGFGLAGCSRLACSVVADQPGAKLTSRATKLTRSTATPCARRNSPTLTSLPSQGCSSLSTTS